VDLGFTEFVTSLLSEVLRSVVAAQSEQEERRRELLEMVDLSVEEFEARHVTDGDVDAWLAQVLPSSDPDRPHDASRGTPYTAARGSQPESPPYAEVLGVELAEKMVSEETGRLLAAGEKLLRATARRMLAERQLQVARDLAAHGVPRVVVDAGRITAKVTFEAMQFRDADQVAAEAEAEAGAATEQPATTSFVTASLAKRVNPIVMAGRLPQLQHTTVVPEALRDVRLRVHTADDRAPGSNTARANVFGEVELTFKTVT
jgi:hypothetical protein